MYGLYCSSGFIGIMENRMEATNIGIMEKKIGTTIVIHIVI